MRILHVTDGYAPRVGGIEVFVEDLATRQARAGHDVTVLTATGAAGDDPDPSGVPVVRTPVTWRHPLAPPLATRTALAGAYDVVHAHLSVLSPFATTVARASDEAGIATVNTVHSMWASRAAVVRATRALADWDRSTAAWTTVSRAAAADMRGLLRPGVPVSVVPNAVDVGWWRSEPGVTCGDGEVTLVSVMRLAGRKRPFAFLDILERVRAGLPDPVGLRAVVVGDGPLGQRLGHEIAGRGLDGVVALAGTLTRTQIRALYRAADVYVAPAYQESFGIAALEARAAGLPVVAMQSGGVGEFVEHGVEGVLCRDDDAMVRALTTLAADARWRAAIARHNAAHPPVHDWPLTLRAFDDVYRQVRPRRDARRRGVPVGEGG